MKVKSQESKISPLLVGHGIPEFNKITVEIINSDMPYLINKLDKMFDDLEKEITAKIEKDQQLEWEEIITPLNDIEEKLRWSWGVVSHLNSVRNTEELRLAYATQQPKVIKITNRIGQSKVIYESLKKIQDECSDVLSNSRKRIITRMLLSMDSCGVGLDQKELDEFNIASERMAEISNIFGNNVLDATKNWSLILKDPKDVEGLPDRALVDFSRAASNNNESESESKINETGPWKIGLDIPSYIQFMTYARNRDLREKLYKAYVSRASKGDLNNNPLIEEILTLRLKQANRLGYRNWADLSLANKMASGVEEVNNLLEDLRVPSFEKAKTEIRELEIYAQNELGQPDFLLKPWDISYWSEKLKKDRYSVDQEKLRPWFPLEKVLNGLFKLCSDLFEISIENADGEAHTWNKDVRYFKVFDLKRNYLASFFLDPYSRPEDKRGGAWMDECTGRKINKSGDLIKPIAYLVCNQTPPCKNMPSLMSFEEVETLFHEFGHGLQHMLTTIDDPQTAGINNVEWDAVELPSQFMENWCLNKDTFKNMAKHWETNEDLPDSEYKKLCESKTFNSGLSTLRQIHFALTDIKLHSEWDNQLGLSPNKIRLDIAKSTTILSPIEEDNFLCAFTHIFSGGYSAGYYSYKWAEVLSADAYSAFEEECSSNKSQLKIVGKRFKDTILSLGGSKEPKEIFKDFRGRYPSTEALKKHLGLLSK